MHVVDKEEEAPPPSDPPEKEEKPEGAPRFDVVLRFADGKEKVVAEQALGIYALMLSEPRPGLVNFMFHTNLPPQERARSLVFLMGQEIVPISTQLIEQHLMMLVKQRAESPVVVTGKQATDILKGPRRR